MNWSDVAELAKEIETLTKELEPLKSFYDEYVAKSEKLATLKTRFAESAKGYVPQVVTRAGTKHYAHGERTLIASEAVKIVGKGKDKFYPREVKELLRQQGHEFNDFTINSALNSLASLNIAVSLGSGAWKICRE